jgi:hypothetical protein
VDARRAADCNRSELGEPTDAAVGARRRSKTYVSLRCIALRRWTLANIHDALGTDDATVLPPLLALRFVTPGSPRTLCTVAAEDGTTVEAYLSGELLDFAGTGVDRMELFTRLPPRVSLPRSGVAKRNNGGRLG